MKTKLLVTTLLTMTIASTVAVGCGSSGSASDSSSSSGAVVAAESDTANTTVSGIMAGTQSDFLRASIVPGNWLKSPLIQDLGFEWDGILPKGIQMKVAPGEWSADPVELALDVKDVVKNKSFTVVGTSKDGKISVSSKISVDQIAEKQLKITVDSKATVQDNPDGAKALAKASENILQVFQADRLPDEQASN